MKRIVTCLLAGLLVWGVGDRLGAFLLRELLTKSEERFTRIYTGRGASDILLLGNSRVDRNLSASEVRTATGKECLNLGLGGLSMVLVEAIIRDYVDRYGDPESILVEAFCVTVDPETVGDMRMFSQFSDRLSLIERNVQPILYLAGEGFHLFRFNTEHFVRAVSAIRGPEPDRLLRGQIDESLLRSIEPVQLINREENLAALQRVVEFAKQRGIRLHVMVAPILPAKRAMITNYGEWKKEIESRIGADSPLLDFSMLLDDEGLFFDTLHLNAKGARAFVRDLVAMGVLEGAG